MEEKTGIPREPFTDEEHARHFAKEEFNLSEKINAFSQESDTRELLIVNDVKEFIKRLKDELSIDGWRENYEAIIDKLAGEKLI